jgi:N-acyl-D-aspartate/D-glutamate deacylase
MPHNLVAPLALLALMNAGLAGTQQPPAYDLIIRNARIVDGAGNPWYRGDLAVRGDTIARIATRIDLPAARTIDAGGLFLAPGFLDIHSHARRNIFEAPTADSSVRQGVTTLIEAGRIVAADPAIPEKRRGASRLTSAPLSGRVPFVTR